jgi:hypothetical protein
VNCSFPIIPVHSGLQKITEVHAGAASVPGSQLSGGTLHSREFGLARRFAEKIGLAKQKVQWLVTQTTGRNDGFD